jgi:glycolate oxidase FAD binding subunit
VSAATLIEWNGALRWFQVDDSSEGEAIRRWATTHGGHATLFRAEFKLGQVFQPLPAPMLTLHRRLKAAFDPAGIFNPRRMYAEF